MGRVLDRSLKVLMFTVITVLGMTGLSGVAEAAGCGGVYTGSGYLRTGNHTLCTPVGSYPSNSSSTWWYLPTASGTPNLASNERGYCIDPGGKSPKAWENRQHHNEVGTEIVGINDTERQRLSYLLGTYGFMGAPTTTKNGTALRGESGSVSVQIASYILAGQRPDTSHLGRRGGVVWSDPGAKALVREAIDYAGPYKIELTWTNQYNLSQTSGKVTVVSAEGKGMAGFPASITKTSGTSTNFASRDIVTNQFGEAHFVLNELNSGSDLIRGTISQLPPSTYDLYGPLNGSSRQRLVARGTKQTQTVQRSIYVDGPPVASNPTTFLTGTVTDGETGKPVPYHEIDILQSGQLMTTIQTDARGRYRVNVANGPAGGNGRGRHYIVRARSRYFNDDWVNSPADDRPTYEWSTDRLYTSHWQKGQWIPSNDTRSIYTVADLDVWRATLLTTTAVDKASGEVIDPARANGFFFSPASDVRTTSNPALINFDVATYGPRVWYETPSYSAMNTVVPHQHTGGVSAVSIPEWYPGSNTWNNPPTHHTDYGTHVAHYDDVSVPFVARQDVIDHEVELFKKFTHDHESSVDEVVIDSVNGTDAVTNTVSAVGIDPGDEVTVTWTVKGPANTAALLSSAPVAATLVEEFVFNPSNPDFPLYANDNDTTPNLSTNFTATSPDFVPTEPGHYAWEATVAVSDDVSNGPTSTFSRSSVHKDGAAPEFTWTWQDWNNGLAGTVKTETVASVNQVVTQFPSTTDGSELPAGAVTNPNIGAFSARFFASPKPSIATQAYDETYIVGEETVPTTRDRVWIDGLWPGDEFVIWAQLYGPFADDETPFEDSARLVDTVVSAPETVLYFGQIASPLARWTENVQLLDEPGVYAWKTEVRFDDNGNTIFVTDDEGITRDPDDRVADHGFGIPSEVMDLTGLVRVTAEKVDVVTASPVPGATYDLWQIDDDAGTEAVAGSATTDASGRLDMLAEYGFRYEWRETTTAPGYTLNPVAQSTPGPLVGPGGVMILPQTSTTALPVTGSERGPWVPVGLALMALGLVGVLVDRRGALLRA